MSRPSNTALALALVCLTLALACDSKVEKPATETKAQAPKPALASDAASADPVDKPAPAEKIATVRIPRTDDRLRSDAVLVQVSTPPKWERDPEPRIAHWEPKGGDGKHWFELSVVCLGLCEPATIDARIDETSAPPQDADPNIEVSAREDIEGGVVQIVRVLRRKQFRVVAYFHRPEDRFAVRVTGVAPLGEEEAYREMFMAAARSLKIVGTSIEKDRADALVLTGDKLIIGAIPKDVARRHKQIKDVYAVTRNIVLAGVPISNEGSINTGDFGQGRRLHKFLLAADHEFANPGGIEGASAKCAEAEWVEDWGDFKFSCTLVAPFAHDGLVFAPFQFIRIEKGIVTFGYLQEDAKIEGTQCKAKMSVNRGSDGKFEECTFG